MSQTADDGQSDNDSTIETLSEACEKLEELSDDGVEHLTDNELVRLRETVKTLDDVSEEARKKTVDSELKSRIPPGASMLGISHIRSHRKYIEEDDATIIGRAISMGIDYTQFVEVKTSALEELDEEISTIEHSVYSYLR